jgi:hypothetical protein
MSPPDKLAIKKFNLASLNKDAVIVLIGKRNTGKSFLTRDILYHMQGMPFGLVVSGSEHVNHFYETFVPKVLVLNEYNDEKMTQLFERQKKIIEKYGKEDPRTRAFVIFDDCLYDSGSWGKQKNIKAIFMNGRHYNILFILTMQYPMGIGPELRTNIDFVFILRENIAKNRRRIHENYAGMFDKYDDFCKAMDSLTEDYGAMVIKNNSHSNKLEDQIYWYKAQPRADYKLCDQKYWELNKKPLKPLEHHDPKSKKPREIVKLKK